MMVDLLIEKGNATSYVKHFFFNRLGRQVDT